MVESIVKFLIDDLNSIRIVCEKCGSIVEMPIEKLNGSGSVMKISCPAGCGDYRIPASHKSDAFARLAEVFRELKQVKGCRIEFVLPVGSKVVSE